MSRLPFDPGRAAGASSSGSTERTELGPAGRQKRRAPSNGDAQPYTVSQVNELIKTTLEKGVASPLRVVGQISNLSAKNHWYFSLKDETAVLSCVAWATDVRKFGFTPKDDDQVVATGHISHYSPQGRTQMYVSALVPLGAGALALKFNALCEELRKLGYFDEARKKPLPVFPRRIAVITSATGAAIQDVINTAAQRCKAIGFLLVDVRVQGDGAAEEVAKAIRWVDAHHRKLSVDAILVTRGGGSIEDLWAFNERIVADAVFKCTLPLVAAIGHESDTTIIELVADVRASTPTQAAMRLIPSSQELGKQVAHLTHRLGFMLKRSIEKQKQQMLRLGSDLRRITKHRFKGEESRIAQLSSRLAQLQPHVRMAQRRTHVAGLLDRLQRATRIRIDDRARIIRLTSTLQASSSRHIRHLRENLSGLERQLIAMDPHSVLRRGYSLTTHADGRLIRSVNEVYRSETIITRVADGALASVVNSSNLGTETTKSANLPIAKSRNRNNTKSPNQMDLFGTSR